MPRIKTNTVHWVISICLFDMRVPTCFGIRVPSSGSFLCPCELHENSRAVCCVYQLSGKRSKQYYNKSAHGPHNSTSYDTLHCNFHVTHKDIGSSLKMAH